MKKYQSYIIAVLLTGAIIALFVTGDNKKEKKPDERITLRKQDKIPYGTYVAYQGLQHLFGLHRDDTHCDKIIILFNFLIINFVTALIHESTHIIIGITL